MQNGMVGLLPNQKLFELTSMKLQAKGVEKFSGVFMGKWDGWHSY